MTDQVFDVGIVGAGPGGSNAAAVALKHGLTVVQVERFTFPRVKPCAGGITIKSCNALCLDWLPSVRGEFKHFEFNVWGKRVNRFTHKPSPMLRMVLRPEFDNWLVSQNRASPRFTFFDGEPVADISYDGVFRIQTTGRTFRCRHLIGADGAYSVVNKRFNVARPKGHAVAVEVNLSRTAARLPAETPPCFDFGAIDRGYGWIFPKDDRWCVGLYTLGKEKNLRGRLTAYIRDKGFVVDGDPLETFDAHLFPYGGYRVSVPAVPVYIVGDAGGFGDAITGEGIYHALESGRIAAETINDCLAGRAQPDSYYRRLRPSVLADTFLTYHASRKFYRDVDRGLTMFENALVWRPFVQGYADGATFTQSLTKGGWFVAKSFLRGTVAHQRTNVTS